MLGEHVIHSVFFFKLTIDLFDAILSDGTVLHNMELGAHLILQIQHWREGTFLRVYINCRYVHCTT